MSQINYAKEIERALETWNFAGEDAAVAPVFNALKLAYENDTHLVAPVHTPDPSGEWVASVHDIKFKELDSTDPELEGMYFIPLFTSQQEVEKGEETLVIKCTLRMMVEVLKYRPKCLGFIINPWGKKVILSKEMIKKILNHEPKSNLSFVNGSVLFVHATAIVNAANESLLGGGGVDGAIHKAAGPMLLEACKGLGGCQTGGAKATAAYDLKNADIIIHAVGPKYSGEEKDANLLAMCYMNALELAWRNNCMSVAFPGISTGVYGFPLEEAAKISIAAVVHWFEQHPDVTMNVYFCCFRQEELQVYNSLTQKNE